MNAVQQIYCTHCTYGSSALEQSDGELAGRGFGYSARAGSLPAAELRQSYRQLEPYVYYFLPRDTPGERTMLLTAATAPRRLFFIPSAGGLQLTGQVCYRASDSEGRPGSYFAHVLFQPEGTERRWSAVDGLRLWGAAGWRTEDSPQIPFVLGPPGTLADFAGPCPAVSDETLRSFLCEPAGATFCDPGGVIPPRWRRMEPAVRRAWFIAAFCGLMQTSPARQDALLVVAEPAVAALVFYGIARLLPDGPLRGALSVSTFEPHPERICTSLAATWFDDPQANGPADVGHVRGPQVNTLLDVRAFKLHPRARYAPAMVRLAVERSWSEVDRRLREFAAAGPKSWEDLESLAAVDDLVPRLLAGKAPPEPHASPLTATYYRAALARQLEGMPDPASQLAAVVGTPAHMSVLQAIVAQPETPTRQRAGEFLLRALPPEWIAEVLRWEALSRASKAMVVAQHVAEHAKFPPGCDFLWEDVPGGEGSGRSFLAELFGRLDNRALDLLARGLDWPRLERLVAELREVCRDKPARLVALTQVVRTVDEEVLVATFRRRGAGFFAQYPADEPAMGVRLTSMLQRLAEFPEEISTRMDLLLASRHLLRDEPDQERLAAWDACRQAMEEVGRWQHPKRGKRGAEQLSQLTAAVVRMAEAATQAMPAEVLADDTYGTRKRELLWRMGPSILQGNKLLEPGIWPHDELWRRMARYFQAGHWPAAPMRQPGSLARFRNLPPAKALQIGIAVAACAITAVALWLTVRAVQQNRPTAQEAAAPPAPQGVSPAPNAAKEPTGAVKGRPAAKEIAEADLPAAGNRIKEPELEPLPRPAPPAPPREKPAGAAKPPPQPPLPVAEIPKKSASAPLQPPTASPEPARGAFDRLVELQGKTPAEGPGMEEPPAGGLKTAMPDGPRPKATPKPPEPSTAGLPIIDGELSFLSRPSPTKWNRPVIARIGPFFVRNNGTPFKDRWFDNVIVEYHVATERTDSKAPPSTQVLRTEKTLDVFDGTAAVRVQVVFRARSAAPLNSAESPIAATAWQSQPIQPGLQYTVHFNLSREGVKKLQELALIDRSPPPNP